MDRRGPPDNGGRVGTAALPPHLLRLFAPRPPLPYAKPLDRDPGQKDEPRMTPVSQYLDMCKGHDTDYVPTLSMAERKKQKLQERKEKSEKALKEGLEAWDPNKDEHVVGDPYKTLHVSRLSYEVTEKELRREFSMYGPIENIRLVKDVEGKPRGYAFIEYEREKDMKAAYKDADGIKILGRRIVVDVERGRTVKGWKPKRLGGGLGGTRIGAPHENQTSSGRDNGSRHDRDRSRGGPSGGDRYGGSSGGRYGGSGDRDRGMSRRYEGGGGYGDRSRGGYSDRSYERDSKRRKSRSRSRSPGGPSRGYGGRRDSRD
ncbi:U1 small nuclear ribonucleoprotein 70kDa [Entomortierella parvispora]|uniref:U1 small nuclear ribonucleoprotein 70 kDa n=1 Tax=Entomortierella parvispora TaxID=205924 RepID=A0A9P3H8L7_9FUNG|nr:U1 small nuclear ribonucleoprotein 70kDa [Entomortierella parvispora]